MKDKAKAGDLKVVQTAQQKVPEKKKRRWDQPTVGDEPSKKKASSWDQAEVGTPSQVLLFECYLLPWLQIHMFR